MHKQVTFRAVVPESCLKKDSHIRMKFILDKTLEPIDVHCEVAQDNALTKTDEHYINITAKARLPLLRLTEQKSSSDQQLNYLNFLYYYVIETPVANEPQRMEVLEENWVLEKGKCHFFSFDLDQFNLKSKKAARSGPGVLGMANRRGFNRNNVNNMNNMNVNDDDNFHLHQYDGFILFGTDYTYASPKRAINLIKKDTIEIMLPLTQLNSRAVKETTPHSRLLKSFARVYHCLCLRDHFYKQTFESVSVFISLFLSLFRFFFICLLL